MNQQKFALIKISVRRHGGTNHSDSTQPLIPTIQDLVSK